MNEAKVIESRRVFEGHVLKLDVETVALPNGATTHLEVLRHPGACAVVPLHADGSLTLIRQYRHATGGYIYEVPAGKIDPGDTPETCARRELIEEVGLDAGALHPLGFIWTTPGFTDEVIHLYLARDLRPALGVPETDEVIEALRVSIGEALSMVADGRICDAKSVVALLRAEQEHRAGRLTFGSSEPTTTRKKPRRGSPGRTVRGAAKPTRKPARTTAKKTGKKTGKKTAKRAAARSSSKRPPSRASRPKAAPTRKRRGTRTTAPRAR